MNPRLEKEIPAILDRVMQEITGRMVGIQPIERADILSEDVCTVCTTFEGGYHGTLVLFLDTALLRRLTQQAMEAEEVAQEDVEDFAKEYLNVICGMVVARLFQTARISSRFRIPVFRVGRWAPDAGQHVSEYVLNYISEDNQGVQLLHQLACPCTATAG